MQVDEATRNAGIGVCMGQAPLLLFLIASYPEPKSVIFTVHFMGNLTNPDVVFDADEYGLSVAYMLVSVCCVLFAFMTLQMQMAHAIDNMVEFNTDVMKPLYIWDAIMWMSVLTSHTLLTLQICSPVDIYLVGLTAVGQTICLWAVCRPGGGQGMSLVVYLSCITLVLSEMHTRHGLRLVVWCMLVIADMLLMMGHTFDSQINIETIANCRVCYNTLLVMQLLLLYTI